MWVDCDVKIVFESWYILNLFVGVVGDFVVYEFYGSYCCVFFDVVKYWLRYVSVWFEFVGFLVK